MAFFGRRLGGLMRQYLIQKLSQESSCFNPGAPSAFVLTRGMASSKLFVGGLTWGTDEETLRDAFSSYGNLTEVKIITDRDTGRSRGFGFVGFTSDAEAESALRAMDGQSLAGRIIRVNYAHSPGNVPRGGGMSRGFGLGTGRGRFGGDFGSNTSFGRSSEHLSNENESFGQSSVGIDNEREGFNRNSGRLSDDGRGLGSFGGFRHEAESFGAKSEVSNYQQGSFDFGSKGESVGFGAASFTRSSTSGFGREIGSRGQRSGGFGDMEASHSQNFPAFQNEGRSGRNFEGPWNHEKDFAGDRGGFERSLKADPGIDDEPSSSMKNDENNESINTNFGVDKSKRFETNGWRGLDHAELNNEEGFVRSSGSLENGLDSLPDSWKHSERDNSSSGDPFAGSTNWRESSTDSYNDWRGPSNASPDRSQPVQRENVSGSDGWRNEGNDKSSSLRGWRDS